MHAFRRGKVWNSFATQAAPRACILSGGKVFLWNTLPLASRAGLIVTCNFCMRCFYDENRRRDICAADCCTIDLEIFALMGVTIFKLNIDPFNNRVYLAPCMHGLAWVYLEIEIEEDKRWIR